jgi:hypothetical protein
MMWAEVGPTLISQAGKTNILYLHHTPDTRNVSVVINIPEIGIQYEVARKINP